MKHIKQSPLLFEWHQHDCYELILTLGATGKRFIADDVHAFEDVDLALLLPGEPHTWDNKDQQAPVGDVVVVLWPKALFAVNINEFEALQTWLEGLEYGCVFSRESALKVKELLLEMGDANALKKLTLLSEVLSLLMRAQIEKEIPFNASSRHVTRVTTVLEVLNKDVTRFPSLSEAAVLANLSISTLKRVFKDSLGVSYSQYCEQLRLKRARHLLATTSLPISVVAQQCGFNSSAYFNQFYKKHENMTPSRFRMQFAWRKRVMGVKK
ncbi:AraC family transcriptional regulator [Pseudoalteromonas luteoviolacea]|uniref:HTH araC/xylS-type domain-containing protein n=1 Tax=Pseudoalteromonas luteoviolacea S4054 TaxID=1129367 RepID=A0A0F6A8P4_9GAMM|nr:AraC family transcriptional regulator [Pseudoalteromonas luteoviolacea]AOT11113.1 hypothetical protein S4054249_25100 [Pseudoalteromonas luteoviolacea]AOT15723.1 hypothetical protein S40542_23410 [Pseudoalteromonas luteoviolacea]AOT20934.1 hypothetical protein S4054_25020 [Pseudoalteromonas luteoviolacea]KKE82216.1 hypothetical protein N479_19150 [Pseudoalteromonas luteoviolacea S4054]KZN65452.1 hypothetical protein N481_25185 [Pseudoalteromonas luteoviolacea S4047-1]